MDPNPCDEASTTTSSTYSLVSSSKLWSVLVSWNSYPIDRLASALAIASFADEQFLQACIDDTRSQRNLLVQSLLKLGYRCLPSEANFVLMEVGVAAAELFASLRERGVVVRYFDKPRLSQFLRVTIGSEAQNRRFLEAVTQWHEARA